MKKFLSVPLIAGSLLLPTNNAEIEVTYASPSHAMELPSPDLPFYKWDAAIPEEYRKDAANAAISRDISVLKDSDKWDQIGMDEWKTLYPPARAAAARNMVSYWSGYYRAGEKAGVPRQLFDETFTAMIIGESEFEHFSSRGGDLGLTMVSSWTRPRLREMYMEGMADFDFSDADYLAPNNAIRAGVFWLNWLLENEVADGMAGNLREAERYMATAVGAYNDSTRNAKNMSPKSMAYRAKVGRIMENCRTSYETMCLALSDSPYHMPQ